MTDSSMTKSELIDRMVSAQAQASGLQLTSKDVELAVKTMLEQMSNTLATGGRIEVRGFWQLSAALPRPPPRPQPETGESVGLSGKHVPHFKPGKELRDRVNSALERSQAAKAGS